MKLKLVPKLELILLALSMFGSLNARVHAADVDVRLSTREAYVGTPIQLQIEINNATSYKPPNLPNIDGVIIRSAGAPSQSSQITIINGRRTEKRSVMLNYLLTPQREGSFTLPDLELNVDGKPVAVKGATFIATKSETGDLLFVELSGSKDKVFVGQPLDMTLKIYIKPFRDRDAGITLDEGAMWQMISDQTSWGSFSDRMRELSKNNQRPGGQEVLRDDGQGSQRSYFLYELDAKIYPTHAGKIDASDVHIIVNYPTALGKARDPFGSLFEDSSFGGDSQLSRMMNDDFFGSRFGNRLEITASRPVVGEVSVDATDVLPVPSEGRPADYRGAVGQYQIVAEASPSHVSAGDPIKLNLGIVGTGPMDLVQAPPLAELPALSNFKIPNEPLAGFVRDNTKLFSTSIRPRHEGISEIPPISFSFFNPTTEKFETVFSNPIAITVDKAESLALEAIVAAQSRKQSSNRSASVSPGVAPSFENSSSTNMLISQAAPTAISWWLLLVVGSPLVWLTTLIVMRRKRIIAGLPSFRAPYGRCLRAIERAGSGSMILAALIRYVNCVLPFASGNGDLSSAVGSLRLAGLYPLAAQFESLAARCGTHQSQATSASELAQRIHESVQAMKTKRIRKAKTPRLSEKRVNKLAKAGPVAVMILGCWCYAPSATATDAPMLGRELANASTPAAIVLSTPQREDLFREAIDHYETASGLVESDPVEAKGRFQSAATKYQLLVDSGIRNSKLYLDLGNAYLQSGQVGRAIANYTRAQQLDPANRQLAANLRLAETLTATAQPPADKAITTQIRYPVQQLRSANHVLLGAIGVTSMKAVAVLASLLFWGLLTVRILAASKLLSTMPTRRIAAIPLLFLLMSLASLWLESSKPQSNADAIIVAGQTALHAADGDQFDEVFTFDAADGQRVQLLAERGDWAQVRTTHGHVGWMPKSDLEHM